MLGTAPAGFNSILIDFDCLLDYKIGGVRILRDYYSDSPLIDKQFLDNMTEDDYLIAYHNTEGDPFKAALSDEAKDSSDNILNEIRTRYPEKIIDYSPPTLLNSFIKLCLENGDIKITINLFNPLTEKLEDSIKDKFISENREFLRINEIDSGRTGFSFKETREIDLRNYARIMTDTSKHALAFGDPSVKSFVVLDYRENFTIIDGKRVLDPELIYMFGDVNKIEYCNAYNLLESPEG